MMNIIKKIFIVIIMLMLFGCYDYQEINNLAIVSGISIDIDENNPEEYIVGIQIMNAKKEEESDNSLITFYKANGNTIYEALEKIMLDSPKKLYLGHNEVLVLSEDLLKKKDPLDYLDYFMRDYQIEKDSLVMVSKNSKAYDVLKIITPLETIPSRNLKSTLSVSDKFSGTLTIVTIDEFISTLIKDGKEPILPSILIKGDISDGQKMDNIKESDPKSKLKFDTLAFFKNNLLVDYMSNDESVGYNFLANVPMETYINIKCDDKNYSTVRVTDYNFKEKLSFQNGKPNVEIEAKITANLLEYNCKADFIKNSKNIENLQNQYSKKVESLVNSTIDTLYIKNKADSLGYTNKFYKKFYKEMKKRNYNKDRIIDDLSFDVNIKVKINSSEHTTKSVKDI